MSENRSSYYFDENNRFVIENYNWAIPFSNFFPGIAGKWGIPLWLYYINRAQAVSSLGIKDKDNAIMEFFSFNKACQVIGNQGFRTFLKIDDNILCEPFKQTKEQGICQKMVIATGELTLNEVNSILGIQAEVEYFPLVNLPIAGFVRKLSIKNLNRKSRKIALCDGLPVILPFGMNQYCVKFIPRHIEAMMQVVNVDGTPLFKLKQVPLDIPQVQEIEGGNFYFTLGANNHNILKNSYVVDPELIFGISGELAYPWAFMESSVKKILASKKITGNKTPCVFTLLSVEIPGRGEIEFYSVVGNTSSVEKLRTFKKYLINHDIREKKAEHKRIIEGIKNNMFTASNNKIFDSYCQQTFLDNIMRGGLPFVFKAGKNKSIFYLYSRKHGDLERDYNYFVLEPTYFSQGNAHFRDVNQNRRNDVWFNPEIADSNVIMFFNLIQTDGYNPLIVNGRSYTARNIVALSTWLKNIIKGPEKLKKLVLMVKKPFTPGEFIMRLENLAPMIPQNKYDEIIARLLSFCKENEVGDLHAGYWIDHWTYNLDLIDTFLMVFPDRLKELLLDKNVYTFYDDPDIVLPRNKKYVLVNGKVRQYNAVVRDKNKEMLIKSRTEDLCKVRTQYGKGKVYFTNLLVKLLCIIANKISSLDPEGIGIEMEADKPGWNDPLNGLPGLMASSLCETLELRRTCVFLDGAISNLKIADESVMLFEDLYGFIMNLMTIIEKRLTSIAKDRTFVFWDESHKIKEDYREKTRFGISGKERAIKLSTVKEFLSKYQTLLDNIFNLPRRRLYDKNGVCYTYFLNKVKKFVYSYSAHKKQIALSNSELPLVIPLEFVQRPLPLFLEGPVHLMKVKRESADKIYRSVKNSKLYDKKLKMFKTNESLSSETFEIGRVKAYSPGWIENEAVYLHMEYKFLLEMLKAGLYKEFYKEIKNVMIPFLNPEVYGRSILDNSSFIVSSAFPDNHLHGRGFQPRLTGASAELLNMWIIMVAGQKPFFIDEKMHLKLRFEPILPAWFFTRQAQQYRVYAGPDRPVEITIPKNCFAFKFLGKTFVIYHNKKRKNTFGKNGVGITSYILRYSTGKSFKVQDKILNTQFARDIRKGRVERIDAFLTTEKPGRF